MTLCFVIVLQAGSGGSAACSCNTRQLASGIVIKFGSEVVDVLKLEDASAPVVAENYDGTASNTVLQCVTNVVVNELVEVHRTPVHNRTS